MVRPAQMGMGHAERRWGVHISFSLNSATGGMHVRDCIRDYY